MAITTLDQVVVIQNGLDWNWLICWKNRNQLIKY